MYTNASCIILNSSVFTNNYGVRGGTMFLQEYQLLAINEVNFVDNTVTDIGGAIYASSTIINAKIEILNTKADNNKASDGGFLFIQGGYTYSNALIIKSS